MAIETRGSWTIDEGVARRWDSAGLDLLFKSEWSAAEAVRFTPLNDIQAQPSTPFPYCVYEKGDARTTQRHTGRTVDTERVIYMVPIQFTVHAESTPQTSTKVAKSGKTIAKEFAKLIKESFDPGTDLLDISPDCHLETFDTTDFHVHLGDQHWAWVVQYDLMIDGTLNALV